MQKRPLDTPDFLSANSMDFDRRRLLSNQSGGSTALGTMLTIANSIITYDGEVVVNNGDIVYKV